MPTLIRTLLLAMAGAIVLLSIPGGAVPRAVAGDPCYHGFKAPVDSVGSSGRVDALACAFAPTVTVIPVGGTVTFHGGRDGMHLVTGANQAWGDRDAELGPGASVSYTFDAAGVYPYACALHRGMSGAVVVGDGGAATALAATLAGPPVEPAPDAPPDASSLVLVALAAALIGGLAVFVTGRPRPRAIVGSGFEELTAGGERPR